MQIQRIEKLLLGVCQIAEANSNIVVRRKLTVDLIVQLLRADFGHWAWGHGDAISNGVTPVAVITQGYDEQQKAMLYQLALDSHMEKEFRKPIIKLMGGKLQHSSRRQCIFSDREWQASRMRENALRLGVDEWVHSVRYADLNTWSNLLLFRKVGEEGFKQSDVELIDLVLTAVPWLHAAAEESLPQGALCRLTGRQATVMLLVLDGYSRKMIAAKLGISQETVGDHLKAIFRHFNVHSATELAAQFLRSKSH